MPRGTEHEPFNHLGYLPTFTTDQLDRLELTSQQAAQFPDLEETINTLNRKEKL